MIKKTVDENKLITGTLEGAENDIIRFISKKAKFGSKYFTLKDESELEDLKLKSLYEAHAKCHQDDEYNEEEGKNIVKYKTLDKYYKGFDGRLKKVIVDVCCFAFDLLNYVYNHIGEGLGDEIIVDIADKTGYIITYEDELDIME